MYPKLAICIPTSTNFFRSEELNCTHPLISFSSYRFSSPTIKHHVYRHLSRYHTRNLHSGSKYPLHLLEIASSQPPAMVEALPSARLVEDMKPLTFQIQSASNTVLKSLTRIPSPTITSSFPSFEDNETTISDLITRTEQTLAMVKAIDAKALEGREIIVHELSIGKFTGKQFILSLALPSFWFHLQTTYSILRMQGVEVGKQDFVGSFSQAWDGGVGA